MKKKVFHLGEKSLPCLRLALLSSVLNGAPDDAAVALCLPIVGPYC